MTEAIKVKKRTGEMVNYDGNRIKLAIAKSMEDSVGEIDETICEEIEEIIASMIYSEGEQVWSVDDISDQVEEELMQFGLHKVAKAYILFRSKRDEERESGDKDLQSEYFSKNFLKKYKNSKEPFEPLGGFVKARTYARWLPEKGRRETWYETVKRAVEFNLSLAKHSKDEAEQLFHNVFYLKQNLSGRMTWLGGTQTAHSNALGLFNCAFDVIDSFDTFVEGFTVLMLGAGLGVRITKDDVVKIPKVRNNIEIINKDYDPILKGKRKEYTSLVERSKNLVEIEIGDSRGGWTTALDMYFKLMYSVQYKDINTIVFNFNNIRERGERIKGFGGKSSGHETLMQMFEKIHEITQQGDGGYYKLKTIDAMDIMCHIALNVVSGNVRRSSLMVLCEEDDYDIINAKSNLYVNNNGVWELNKKLEHRQMSNNTIIYKDKPTQHKFHENFTKLRYTGEPATLNLEQALKRNPNAKGLNPLTD